MGGGALHEHIYEKPLETEVDLVASILSERDNTNTPRTFQRMGVELCELL